MAGFASWAIYFLGFFIVAVTLYNLKELFHSFFGNFFDCCVWTLSLHKWTWIPFILGSIAGVYYVYVGVNWLVGVFIAVVTSWITWTIIGSIALAICIYYVVKAVIRHRYRSLERKLKDELSIPVKKGAIGKHNFDNCKMLLNRADTILQEIHDGSDKEQVAADKRRLADIKLEIFYRSSIVAEASGMASEEEFKENFFSPLEQTLSDNDWNRMRRDKDEALIRAGKPLALYESIPEDIALLNDNKMTPFVQELKFVSKMETTKFFGLVTDTGELRRKTNALKNLYEAAKDEYEELSELSEKINYMLKYARTCAFRNIYLGVELLNVIRENAGGSDLETAQDFVEVDLQGDRLEVDQSEISLDTTAVLADSLGASLSDIGGFVENNLDYVLENPRESAGAAALAVIGTMAMNYLEERNRVIENNLEIQEKILTEMPVMLDSYEAGQAAALRACEILKAIIRANAGFMAIYAPLRDKVFLNNQWDKISLKDVQQLAKATSDYNKISKSEL